MKRNLLSLGLLLLMAMLPAVAADSPSLKPSAPATAATNAPSQQVIAYYFHGSVRCRTCQRIEMLAKETMENNFETELNAKRLVFKPVNYDLPENAHFLLDYKLPCPSLVLVRRDNGKDAKGTLLGKTWDLIGDEAEFNRYIEAEVAKCLRGECGKANSTTNAAPSPAPNPR
jgi:hypothetical protein